MSTAMTATENKSDLKSQMTPHIRASYGRGLVWIFSGEKVARYKDIANATTTQRPKRIIP